jgi:hypothetical protein
MPEEPSGKDGLAQWASLGLPAFLTILAPWHDRFFEARLIEDWYQPTINIAATILGTATCFAVWWTGRKMRQRTLRRLCIASLAMLAAAILICLWLNSALGIFWHPEPGWEPIVRLAWQGVYLIIFMAFSTLVSTGMLLATVTVRPRR